MISVRDTFLYTRYFDDHDFIFFLKCRNRTKLAPTAGLISRRSKRVLLRAMLLLLAVACFATYILLSGGHVQRLTATGARQLSGPPAGAYSEDTLALWQYTGPEPAWPGGEVGSREVRAPQRHEDDRETCGVREVE